METCKSQCLNLDTIIQYGFFYILYHSLIKVNNYQQTVNNFYTNLLVFGLVVDLRF